MENSNLAAREIRPGQGVNRSIYLPRCPLSLIEAKKFPFARLPARLAPQRAEHLCQIHPKSVKSAAITPLSLRKATKKGQENPAILSFSYSSWTRSRS